ncbi:MAG: hypothetical protein E6H08_02975 [Bacteroidetes bacterium]|nr:MAG: hypothetical protein E6H08_02975 [Bacteroidota bacterium]
MMKILFVIAVTMFSINSSSQTISFDKSNLEANGAYMSIEKMNDKKVVKIVKDSTQTGADLPTFVKIKNVDFKDGTIEVKVLSQLLKNAPASARGFIGIAFHIDPPNSKFEGIYLRPTNGRTEDQLRRNHSIQYFSYPDYDFDRLRKEANGVYESYADMGLNEWITMRIEVQGKQAKLFLNDNKQPSLIVNDLKLGDNVSGAIGLWVDIGTEGYFKDLKITKN